MVTLCTDGWKNWCLQKESTGIPLLVLGEPYGRWLEMEISLEILCNFMLEGASWWGALLIVVVMDFMQWFWGGNMRLLDTTSACWWFSGKLFMGCFATSGLASSLLSTSHMGYKSVSVEDVAAVLNLVSGWWSSHWPRGWQVIQNKIFPHSKDNQPNLWLLSQ